MRRIQEFSSCSHRLHFIDPAEPGLPETRVKLGRFVDPASLETSSFGLLELGLPNNRSAGRTTSPFHCSRRLPTRRIRH